MVTLALLFRPCDDAAGAALSAEIVEDDCAMSLQRTGDLLHGFDADRPRAGFGW